ncbi:MAG: hypothetical protein IKC52_02100 [Clostridia bacterium]|nr:hypothetical protein [Clostridia bacterium]
MSAFGYKGKKITASEVKQIGGWETFLEEDAITYVSPQMDDYHHKYKYFGLFRGEEMVGYTVGYSYYVPAKNGMPFHKRFVLLEYAIEDYGENFAVPQILLINLTMHAQKEGCCMLVLDVKYGISQAFQEVLEQAGALSNGSTCCVFLKDGKLTEEQKMLEQKPNHVLPWEDVWFLQSLGFEIQADACTWKNKEFFISVCRLTGNVYFSTNVIVCGETPKLNNNAVRSLIHLVVKHISVLFPKETVWLDKPFQTENGTQTVDMVYSQVAVLLDEKQLFKRQSITPAIKSGYDQGLLKMVVPYSVEFEPRFEKINASLVITPIKILL